MNKTEIDTKFEIAEILVKHLDCDTSKVLSPLYDYLQKQLILSGVSQQRELLEAYQHFIDWNEEHDRKASTSERIESFIASNCG